MTPDFTSRLLDALTFMPRLPLRAWAEQNIIIPDDYPSPLKGRFSMAQQFLWHEPCAMVDAPSVREIVVVKPPQLGGGQNWTIPAAMRALRLGYPVLYVTDEKQFAEQFRIERLLPLLKASPAFQSIQWREREVEVYLSNGGMLAFTFGDSRSGKKGRPFFLVICDEYDGCEFGIAESLRGRITRYEKSGAKILYLSQLDPKARRKLHGETERTVTPILLEYDLSSQGQWMMTDPAGGKPFTFTFGLPDTQTKTLPAFGVKWGEVRNGVNDAKRPYGWSEARIMETARIVTPGGATLTDEQRKALLATGSWVHEISDRCAIKPGYKCNCLHDAGRSLGKIVLDFLAARSKGPEEFRTWITEQLVELPYLEKIEIHDQQFAYLTGAYPRGTPFYDAATYSDALKSCPFQTLGAVDVQAQHNGLWMLVADLVDCREVPEQTRTTLRLGAWTLAIRDWIHAFKFEECAEVQDRYGIGGMICDAKYEIRRAETYQACQSNGWLPAIGHASSLLNLPWRLRDIDPGSTRKAKGRQYVMREAIYRKEPIALQVLGMINNGDTTISLLLPDTLDEILTSQLSSVRMVDGVLIESKNNHLFDDLCQIVLLAKMRGAIPA